MVFMINNFINLFIMQSEQNLRDFIKLVEEGYNKQQALAQLKLNKSDFTDVDWNTVSRFH